jgi:hypothetical protein
MHNATASAKSPKQFHIFHKRHIRKTPGSNKGASSTENSMVATAHLKQQSRIMCKAVGQSVYGRRGRQSDPEETTRYISVAHYPRDLIQGVRRHFGVCMQKPKDIAACDLCSGIHLSRTAAVLASDHLIA